MDDNNETNNDNNNETIDIDEFTKEFDDFFKMMMAAKRKSKSSTKTNPHVNMLTNSIEEAGENETSEEYDARTKRNRTMCMLMAFESSQKKIEEAGGNAELALIIDIAKEHEENLKNTID